MFTGKGVKTMTREQAIINGEMVLNYLSTNYPESYMTMDVNPHEVRVHYLDLDKPEQEVKGVLSEVEELTIAGADITTNYNENIGQTTFDIIWPYGYKDV